MHAKDSARADGVTSPLSRRKFIATSSTALAASSFLPSIKAAEGSEKPKLALHGGAKTVKESRKAGKRWGDPERERLNAMLEQDSLFYWQGPQTKLLKER